MLTKSPNSSDRMQLREFAETILAENLPPGDLRLTLHRFEAWLIARSELDIDSDCSRENIYIEHAMALGPTWAAICIEDLARTRQFMRGTFQAILACQSNNQGQPVHVLYAGCGPFALLVLPLLTQFTEQQLRLTLIDINPISVKCVQRLFTRLNLHGYVEELLLADAVTMKISKPDEIDIVLSETMQRSLKNECQVQIMCNLMRQLSETVLMVPERITLTLARRDFSKPLASSTDVQPFETLGTLFDFSTATIRGGNLVIKDGALTLHTDGIVTTMAHAQLELYVLTSIHVFGDAHLLLNESGLSTPERIPLPSHLARTHANHDQPSSFPVRCNVRYLIDPKARIALTIEPVDMRAE